MKRVFLIWVVLLLPIMALADGKVIPPVAVPAKVTIPDQRALIHYTNGTERLVIETRFTGSGTNFAWIVPLPSQPVVEEASIGLFPTLQYLFRPQIVHTVPHYYVGILLVILFLVLLRSAAKRSALSVGIFLLLTTIFAALLLPALSASRSKSMGSSSNPAVAILDRKIVGIYETVTIASHDPKALQTWLRENGFVVSTNDEPAIESYVKDGWVFVAAKVAREHPEHATSVPHPLSFTFKTDKPVYPMRLTGVDNGSLEVELYVFGPVRAKAARFKIERCTHPNYPNLPPNTDRSRIWSHSSPETPNIVHPLLRKWVDGSSVATKLTARLSPADMRQDVWLEWISFAEKRNRLFSRSGALTTALNWGSGLLAIGLFASWLAVVGSESRKSGFGRLVRKATFLSAILCGAIYFSLPKTEVRLVKGPGSNALHNLFQLYLCLLDDKPTTRVELSGEVQRLLAIPTNDVERIKLLNRPRQDFDNHLLGGRIREEDSPGNFILRENGNTVEFVIYDAEGKEQIWEEVWPLRAKP